MSKTFKRVLERKIKLSRNGRRYLEERNAMLIADNWD